MPVAARLHHCYQLEQTGKSMWESGSVRWYSSFFFVELRASSASMCHMQIHAQDALKTCCPFLIFSLTFGVSLTCSKILCENLASHKPGNVPDAFQENFDEVTWPKVFAFVHCRTTSGVFVVTYCDIIKKYIFIELFPILLNCHCGFVWFRHLKDLVWLHMRSFLFKLISGCGSLLSGQGFQWLLQAHRRSHQLDWLSARSLQRRCTVIHGTCCDILQMNRSLHQLRPSLATCFFRTSPFFLCCHLFSFFFKTIFCASCALVYVLLQGLKPPWRRWKWRSGALDFR